MGMESLARRVTDIYIRLLLLVFPLWTGLEGYARITRWKFAFYTVLTCIWAVLLVFFAVRERRGPQNPRAFALLAAALAVWAAVSAAASEYGGRTLLGWNYDGLLPLILYVTTALGVAGYGKWRKNYVNLLAVSVSLCCLVALLQLAGLNPLWLYPEGYDYYDAGVRYTGTFLGTLGNTNILGAFLCLSVPLFVFSAAESGGKGLWLLVPAALGTAVIVLSRSEAGLMGLLAAAFAGVPYHVKRKRGGRAFRLVLAAEAALLLAALAALYLIDFGSGTLWEAHEILHGRVQDGFGSSRIAIWREALRLFAERPLLGGGPGTFGLRSTLEFSRFVEETGVTLTTRADNAHCAALSFLTDLGVPGALLWLGGWAYVFRRWLAGAAPAAGTALASYFVQAAFGPETCFVLPLVCVLCGCTASDPGDIRVYDPA